MREVPFSGGVDTGTYVPLAKPHHLEALVYGESAAVGVLIGLEGGGEAFVESFEAGGGAGSSLRLGLFWGEGAPLGFLIQYYVFDNQSTVTTNNFA